jgi:hypothetical protein
MQLIFYKRLDSSKQFSDKMLLIFYKLFHNSKFKKYERNAADILQTPPQL